MSARVKVCPRRGCGTAVVWATAPNGGRLTLDPYPTADGRYRVVVRAGKLTVVTAPTGEAVKRYDPHRCPARDAVPRVRPIQTALPIPAPEGRP